MRRHPSRVAACLVAAALTLAACTNSHDRQSPTTAGTEAANAIIDARNTMTTSGDTAPFEAIVVGECVVCATWTGEVATRVATALAHSGGTMGLDSLTSSRDLGDGRYEITFAATTASSIYTDANGAVVSNTGAATENFDFVVIRGVDGAWSIESGAVLP